uniref:Uncharacterized protein n=1 Tax=Romanomermis culicivorax TaxID=13658 RepID=A0A915K721_ROMCU
MPLSDNEKIALLSMIKDNKDLLFGLFSTTVTKTKKQEGHYLAEPRSKFNKIDDLVFDIIGREMAALDGLNISETWEESKDSFNFEGSPKPCNKKRQLTKAKDDGLCKASDSILIDEDLFSLKKQKLALEIEELKLRNENWRLQNKKIEVETYNMENRQ